MAKKKKDKSSYIKKIALKTNKAEKKISNKRRKTKHFKRKSILQLKDKKSKDTTQENNSKSKLDYDEKDYLIEEKKNNIDEEREIFEEKNIKLLNKNNNDIKNELTDNIEELMKEFDNISISDNSCESNDNLDEIILFLIIQNCLQKYQILKKIKYNSNERNNQDKELDTENI